MAKQRFKIQDVRYVLKNQGNYQVRFPQSQTGIIFKDFFELLEDERLIPNQKLTQQVVVEARQKFRETKDFKEIFRILKNHGIPIHETFQVLLERRRRKLPSILQQSELQSIRRVRPKTTPRLQSVVETIRIPAPTKKASPTPVVRTPKISVMPTVKKTTIKKQLSPIQLTTALSSSPKRRRMTSMLPTPFEPDTRVTVQVNKQQSRFYIPNMSDCLSIKYNRSQKTLYVETILWFRKWEKCFRKKINLHQIVQFLKEQADKLGCEKIYLDDQSYIPIPALTNKMVTDFNNDKAPHHHPPFLKVLNTLSEGQTFYMKSGFFCLPKKLFAHVDSLLAAHPERRTHILNNVGVINRAFSRLILDCVSRIPIVSLIGDSLPLPDELNPGSTVQELARSLKKQFQHNISHPTQDISTTWKLYDELSKATFARKELFQVSSKEGKERFFPVYLSILNLVLSQNLEPENLENKLLQEELHLVPERDPFDPVLVLRNLLWSLSSSFSETAMYRRSQGWTNFHLS